MSATAAAAVEPCAVCGNTDMHPHLAVAGEMGEAGLIPTTDAFGTALADIVRCPRCGHMQLARFPTEEDLSEAYGEAESEDYIGEEEGQRATARAILERIEHQVAPGALLDLGCWVGFLPDEARKRGWQATGVEPSEFASAYARDRLGLDVRTEGLFEADLEPGAYDAVFMGDVIEHLPAAGDALDRIAELLTADGVLALALPDAGSRLARAMGKRWWSVLPTHVHYFTRASLTALLVRHGYRVVSISTQPKTFTAGYYLGRLGGYSDGLGRAVVGTAGAVGLRDRLWTPDFRDRMLVIARRG